MKKILYSLSFLTLVHFNHCIRPKLKFSSLQNHLQQELNEYSERGVKVARDSIDSSLIAEYSRPDFSYTRLLFVDFKGENAIYYCDKTQWVIMANGPTFYESANERTVQADLSLIGVGGGPLREYFWLGSEAFANKQLQPPNQNFMYFEGEEDHKIPQSEVSHEIYEAIGRFMVDMALFNYQGFPGLSPAIVYYMMARKEPTRRKMKKYLNERDIPDYEDREQYKKAGKESKLGILYRVVIENRLPQLHALRRAYQGSPFGKNSKISRFEARWHKRKIFPRMKDLIIDPTHLIGQLVVVRSSNKYTRLEDDLIGIIRDHGNDPAWIRKLVLAWTGFGSLNPDIKLKVNHGEFKLTRISTCTFELVLPHSGLQEVNDKAALEKVLSYIVENPLSYSFG